MGVIEEVRTGGGDIRLADLNETVRNIFDILGFNHLYRIFPSEVEAVLSFREGGDPGSPPA
jgi:anti-sigma B factor antagonist